MTPTVEEIIARAAASRDMDMARDAAHSPSPQSHATNLIAALEAAGFVIARKDGENSRTGLEAVRARVKPDSIIFAGDIVSGKFTRKEIFNALTYLARTGELAHIGYGKYQSPPADPQSPSGGER